MKKLVIMIAVVFAACSGAIQQERGKTENAAENKTDKAATVQLNNGLKWKADSVTKGHVITMVHLLADSIYSNPVNTKQLTGKLQANIDGLVKDCSMKGAEHEALHVWMEQILHDVKELRENETDEYDKTFRALKTHVVSFYDYFE